MDKKETLRLSVWKNKKTAGISSGPFDGMGSTEKSADRLFADRRLVQALGLEESEPLEREQAYLPAPAEVHFSITNKCRSRYPYCYVGDDRLSEGELGTAKIKKAIDSFAEMGVSQIVFGGGEPFAHPDILEIAGYTRDKGIIPNITTNGFYVDEIIAKECRTFGRININIDEVSDGGSDLREEDSFKQTDKTVTMLMKNEVKVGLNVLVSAENFTRLGEICKYASTKRVDEVLLLRYKPFGKGVDNYEKLGLKPDHLKVLLPMTQRLTKRFGTKFRMDCSLFPALAFHNIDSDMLSYWGTSGCDAGNRFVSIMADGSYKACSFCFDDAGSVFDIDGTWHTSPHLNRFRNWISMPADPCVFCKYLELCKGGCHTIAHHETGNFSKADPACPIVADFKRGIIHAALSA
jgi:radical SAM protein with 4Fe4S-binding SPASM domain